jgi:ribonuclease P/MRP protein subunit RPP40
VALRSKKAVDIIYLDYAKAFDSVVHSKLIAKLICYGVNDMLLKWIESFLVGRSQFVRIGSSISNSCAMLSGVPQGSVLGPVLFIMYVNDTPRSRGVSIKLFADDTRLYTVLQDDSIASTELQNCVDAICEWSNEWQLKLAPAKYIVMRIRSGHPFKCSPSYHIGANSLPVVASCTDLGVSYDDRLSFSLHLSKIVFKASQRAKFILKCFRSRNSQLLMRAFCTFVRPLLEFSSVIWSPYTIADLNRMEFVQRSFTKAIQNLRFSTYKERLINLCSLLTVCSAGVSRQICFL